MQERILKLLSRLEQVEDLLGRTEVLSDQKEYRALTQEHAYLAEVKEAWNAIHSLQKQKEENQDLLKSEKDPEFLSIIKEDQVSIETNLADYSKKLENL